MWHSISIFCRLVVHLQQFDADDCPFVDRRQNPPGEAPNRLNLPPSPPIFNIHLLFVPIIERRWKYTGCAVGFAAEVWWLPTRFSSVRVQRVGRVLLGIRSHGTDKQIRQLHAGRDRFEVKHLRHGCDPNLKLCSCVLLQSSTFTI